MLVRNTVINITNSLNIIIIMNLSAQLVIMMRTLINNRYLSVRDFVSWRQLCHSES